MAIELVWICSVWTSALHAAAALGRGAPLADQRIAASLAGPAAQLHTLLVSLSIEPERFFEHALPLSARMDVPRELAEVILRKVVGGPSDDQATAALARMLTELGNAFQRVLPDALNELELRAEPLRLQWEARGPGLLAELARLTDPGLMVSEAEIVLVQPALGGDGSAHWLYNSVQIEAVLANPIAELPEVVRLGWLLSQLNLDLPMFEGDLRRSRLREVGALAMIPPVLVAASEVELARFEPSTLSTALTAWRAPAAEALLLVRWWETYIAIRPPWIAALRALDQMLGGESTGAASSPQVP